MTLHQFCDDSILANFYKIKSLNHKKEKIFFPLPKKPHKLLPLERHPDEPVAAQVLRPVRRRFRLVLDGGRSRVPEAAPPVPGEAPQVRHYDGTGG